MNNTQAKFALECRDLTVRTGIKYLVKDISFHVQEGEALGLIGSNGAGKSTLFKAMLGLIPPTIGHCHFFGQHYHQPSSRQHLIFLPEKFQPAPALTGLDFLNTTSTLNDQLDEVCEILNFSPTWLGSKIKTYSKGMLQKLGLLYFLTAQKKLLIADELMSGLDMQTRTAVGLYLKKKQANGHTLVFSTHLLFDLYEICDRVLWLEEGKIKWQGTIENFQANKS